MRTIDEIYNSLLEKKATYPELDDLNSPSKVAIWRLLLWIFSFAVYVNERIFEQYKNEIALMIKEEKAHSKAVF